MINLNIYDKDRKISSFIGENIIEKAIKIEQTFFHVSLIKVHCQKIFFKNFGQDFIAYYHPDKDIIKSIFRKEQNIVFAVKSCNIA